MHEPNRNNKMRSREYVLKMEKEKKLKTCKASSGTPKGRGESSNQLQPLLRCSVSTVANSMTVLL